MCLIKLLLGTVLQQRKKARTRGSEVFQGRVEGLAYACNHPREQKPAPINLRYSRFHALAATACLFFGYVSTHVKIITY